MPGDAPAAPKVPVQGVRHVFHHDVSYAVFYLEVVDGGDVGMVQTGCEPGFPLEGFQVLGVVSDRLVDYLDGDDAVQRGIPGAVDRSLTASGYPLKYLVSADSLEHGW